MMVPLVDFVMMALAGGVVAAWIWDGVRGALVLFYELVRSV